MLIHLLFNMTKFCKKCSAIPEFEGRVDSRPWGSRCRRLEPMSTGCAARRTAFWTTAPLFATTLMSSWIRAKCSGPFAFESHVSRWRVIQIRESEYGGNENVSHRKLLKPPFGLDRKRARARENGDFKRFQAAPVAKGSSTVFIHVHGVRTAYAP